jgi:transposase-like protein
MPRERNPVLLVNPNEIMTVEQIKDEEWTMFTLITAIADKLECIKWLARRRLLVNVFNCAHCGEASTLNVYQQHVDGYRWKCNPCNSTASIKTESWFARSHVSLQKLVQMMYFWSSEMPMHLVKREIGVSEHTCIDWFNFYRDICSQWVVNNFAPIGGLDDNYMDTIVEIDESCFFRRKHNVGRVGPHKWVFGGVQRGTRKCFLVSVPNRTRQTLQPVIEQNIQHGTRVMTDGWGAYAELATFGGGGVYSHNIVVHQHNFVNPIDPAIHTQSVESMWKRAKKKLRNQSGTSQALFPSYIREFMWRENVCKSENKDVFSCIIGLIAVTYVL